MHFHYSASALALIIPFVLAQDCPTGYERSKISWKDCSVKEIPTLQCSTLEVPLDYSKPAGDILSLRLVRVPAVSANPQSRSIIYNPGGPGNGGIGSLIGNGNGLNIQKIVGNNFHIVSFDPRGTGLSIPFGCPYSNRTEDYKDTDVNIQGVFDALTRQADKCAETEWKDLNALMGTAYVARDIKAIAEALGEDGLIRYLGYSYGTLLGATTAAMFPDLVGRMVLDGNINPTDYYHGLGSEAIEDVDKSVARFFDLCAEAGPANCAIAVANQTGTQLHQKYDDFLSTLTYAQSYLIRDQFFDSLYGPSRFKAQATLLKGHYNTLGSVSERSLHERAEEEGDENEEDDGAEVGEWNPEDSHDDGKDLALQGITCGDWIAEPGSSPAKFKEWLGIYKSASKYAGDQGLLTTLYQCSLWKNDAKERFTGSFSNVKTKNPIMFVNTQYDPVTPLISAQKASAGFIDSRVLVSTGGGHCSTAQPSKELNAAIKQYFADASFPLTNKIYDPDRPNYFITPRRNTTTAARTNSTTTVRSKRSATHANLFKDMPFIVKRQTTIPAGCVKSNSTSSLMTISSSTTMSSSMSSPSHNTSTASIGSGHSSYQSSSSTRSASHDDQLGGTSIHSNGNGGHSSSTTRSDGYGGYSSSTSRADGYGGYASSSTPSASHGGYTGGSPSSLRLSTPTPVYDGYANSNASPNRPTTVSSPLVSHPPSVHVPITKTITETTCETITKCSGTGGDCQVASVITKTSVRTTVMTVPTSPLTTVVTGKSSPSSAPGQVYNAPPNSNKPLSASGAAPPSYGSQQGTNPAPSSAPGQVYNVPQNSKPSSASVVGPPSYGSQQGTKPSSAPAANSQVYGTPSGSSPSAPIYQPAKSSGPGAIPSSFSRGISSVATGSRTAPANTASTGVAYNGSRPSGTPTGWTPAQFTGAATTNRAMHSLVGFFVAFTSIVFIL